MKRINLKVLSAVLTVSLLGTLAVGCGKKDEAASSGSSSEKITLNVWHQWSNDSNALKKVYEDAVAKYEKDHSNIKIKSDSLDTEAYKTKINTTFAGNTSDVDVFYYWGAGKAKKLADAGKLLPLDDYVKDGTLDKIQPGSDAAFRFDGKLYSLPMFSWVMNVYCNKEIFDKNGVKIPNTYDELLDAVKKLSAKGVTPIVNGSKDGWNAGFVYWALALREVGAQKVNEFLAGKADFSDPGFKEAAKKMQELNAAGAFGKNTLATSSDEADSQFCTGKAAMRIMGSWFAGNVYQGKDSTVKDKVVAIPIPMSTTGKGLKEDYAGGFIESFFVNANTKHKKESVEFCKYIDEVMGNAAHENSVGFTGWKDTVNESNLNPLTKAIAEQSKSLKNGVLAWDTSLDENTTTIDLEAIQSLLGNKITPDEFVQKHQDAIKNK